MTVPDTFNNYNINKMGNAFIILIKNFFFRLVEEVKEKCAVIIEAEEVYMNTR